MPKVKPLGRFAEKNARFSRVLKSCMALSGKSYKELCARTRQCESTFYKRMNHPETLRVEELQTYIVEMGIPEDEVLDFLYLHRKRC
ncbi:MAG: hypothetical protein HFH58_16630 [Lachnospiraceae bacterium]|nr:hypothetical protein [Lachnospiraceae bacterium]